MISFIKAALREIDHVVWPTEAETRKYFTIVTIMIGISTVVLFTFGTFVSKGMFAIRAVTPHDVSAISTVNTPAEDILKDLNLKKQPATDAAVTSGPAVVTPAMPAVSTGAVSTEAVAPTVVAPVVPVASTGSVAIPQASSGAVTVPANAPAVSSGAAVVPVPAAKTSTGTAPSVPVIPKK
jgi:preprotein translocase SecE subunit